MARPRKNIDPEQVRKLAGLGLTQRDIASFVGCSQSLISQRFSSFYDLGASQSKKVTPSPDVATGPRRKRSDHASPGSAALWSAGTETSS